MSRSFAVAVVLGAAWLAPLAAQTPANDVQAHLTRARALAGSQFLTTEETQCDELAVADPYRPDIKQKTVPPAQIFDNLDYIGTTWVGAWVINTSQGIILVDAMHTDQVNSTLLPGFKKLGLDPAQVKYVIVTQAEGDAYGGAKYFQDKYSAQVIMSSPDWAMVAEAASRRAGRGGADSTGGGRRGGSGGQRGGGGGGGGGGFGGGRGGGGGFGGGRGGGGGGFGRGGGGGGGGGGMGGGRGSRGGGSGASGATDAAPSQDQVAVNGQTFTLGNETVEVLVAPMHTDGSLSVIVPVTEHGAPHVAAIIGGTQMPRSEPMKTAYVTSVERLAHTTDSLHVDVELNSHPFVDNAAARMDTLRRAAPGTANPFVIGTDTFQRFMQLLGECGQVALLHPNEVD
jgi:glyoxylase-like metal-dependent hydrolase (beta-lactamase superfamily II)